MSDYFREVYGRQEEQTQQYTDSPAFPMLYEGTTRTDSTGMTIRDYFAAKALQGFTADPGVKVYNEEDKEYVANLCYKMADAMLKARNNK